jgi:hypothetical protein
MKPELFKKLKRVLFGPDGIVPFVIDAFDWRPLKQPKPSGMNAEAVVAILKEHSERVGGLGFTIENARIADGAIKAVPASSLPGWQNDRTLPQEKQD